MFGLLEIILSIMCSFAFARKLGTGIRQTFINGRKVTLLTKMLTLDEGSYAVQLEQEDAICVKIEKQNGQRQIVLNPLKPLETVDHAVVDLIVYSIKSSPLFENNIEFRSFVDYAATDFHANVSDELVEWVDTDGQALCILPRPYIHKFNLIHRGMGVLLANNKGEIFVHKRASTKRVFPSMYDMFIGGVSSAGESSIETLVRELKEEVDIDISKVLNHHSKFTEAVGSPINIAERSRSSTELRQFLTAQSNVDSSKVDFIGKMTCNTSYNHCIVDCYLLSCSGDHLNIRFADGEIEEGSWMTLASLQSLLESSRQSFVPDGLQVWDALPRMLAQRGQLR